MKPSIFLSPNSFVSDQATFSLLLQSYTGSETVQGPPVSVVGPIICPRSHSTKAISNAKIKTVKLTVVVVAGYLICSAPYICIQLYVVLAQKPDMGLCKLAKVMKDILRVSIPTAVGFLGTDSTESFEYNKLQEVPAFRDFWFQRVIMKCGDHEFRGLFLV